MAAMDNDDWYDHTHVLPTLKRMLGDVTLDGRAPIHKSRLASVLSPAARSILDPGSNSILNPGGNSVLDPGDNSVLEASPY